MSDLEIRRATAEDIAAIVNLLTDDGLGAGRETDPGDAAYQEAFLEVNADPRQKLVVGVLATEIVATAQLTIIPGLSRRGAKRALIEAVRVRGDRRGAGIGHQLIRWAIDEARLEGCAMLQLTTDRARADAQRFYTSLGFEPSHVGMKLAL